MVRPRLSRIFYRGKFFYYPLKPFDTLRKLGLFEAVRIVLSYLRSQIRPFPSDETFEHWVTNRFGKRLFETFFKTYTEKVWGIPCSELKGEWAAQRIKDLSLKTVILNFFLKPRRTVTTLIEEFRYPRLGPGMMWRAFARQIENRGGEVRTGAQVVKISRRDNTIESVVVSVDGAEETISGTDFISSMPVTELLKRLDPKPPERVLEAALGLKYRDFLTVCLILDQPHLFSDNWIYIHEPGVQVARIQNFKNWSPEMVPDASKTSLGLEYFCNDGDALWTMSDADLLDLGKRELARIGLARVEDVVDGCVRRVGHSYPVYDSDYRQHLEVVRAFVDGLENCTTVGRSGLHRYNNQDHSMLTGLLAVRNLLHGETHDLWKVNAEEEYLEEVDAKAKVSEEALKDAVALVLWKVDAVALGVASGVVSGAVLFLMTVVLLLKGGPVVGPTLSLLGEYFPGYAVTPFGSLLGLVYGGLCGYVAGWSFAYLRNLTSFLYIAILKRRIQRDRLRKLLDYI